MQLDAPLGLLLAVAGFLLQYFMRQFSKVPERFYHLAAVVLCLGVYLLSTPTWNEGTWREVTIRAISWLAEKVPAVWGGTFIGSNVAKANAAANPGSEARSLLVPVTDSK